MEFSEAPVIINVGHYTCVTWDFIVPSVTSSSSGSSLRSFFPSLSINFWVYYLFVCLFILPITFLLTSYTITGFSDDLLPAGLSPLSVIFQQEMKTVTMCFTLPRLMGDLRLVQPSEQGFPLCHQHLIRHIFMLQSNSGESLTSQSLRFRIYLGRMGNNGDKVGTENRTGKYASENWEKSPAIGLRLLKLETSLKSSSCKGERRECLRCRTPWLDVDKN